VLLRRLPERRAVQRVRQPRRRLVAGAGRFLRAHFSYRIAAATFTNDARPDVVLLTPSGPKSEFALYVNTTRKD
jgi:hypothetical protein